MTVKLSELCYSIKAVPTPGEFKSGEYYIQEAWWPDGVFVYRVGDERDQDGRPCIKAGTIRLTAYEDGLDYSRPSYRLNKDVYSQQQLDKMVLETGYEMEQALYTALIV